MDIYLLIDGTYITLALQVTSEIASEVATLCDFVKSQVLQLALNQS